MKVSYLGPRGTYSEKAAKQYFGQDAELVARRSIPDIFQDVKSGRSQLGIVPIENSIEGSVNQTMDLLASEDQIHIIGEEILSIEHALMAKADTTVSDLQKVLSHGQPLAQCRNYLERELPNAEIIETLSTADAAIRVINTSEHWAVIGSPEAAELYGLTILNRQIANCTCNKTRFIVIAPREQVVDDANKMSILISITDRAGGLYQVLKEFALRNINLTKIESRPAKSDIGDYLFYIDFSGSPQNLLVMECLHKVQELTATFKVLGAFKSGHEKATPAIPQNISLADVRRDIDIIDRQIVELLAKRTELVNHVGQIKNPSEKVRDKAREASIIQELTSEAKSKGVSPALIKQLYGILFDHFVELQEIKRGRKNLSKLTGKFKRGQK